jgi:hypothetical protein
MTTLAEVQLRLDVIGADSGGLEAEIQLDPVDAALAYHGGDWRAAIDCLIQDVAHLREELFIAEHLMSRGLSRGWKPRYERD